MDITGNSVVQMLKNANLKKGFNGFSNSQHPFRKYVSSYSKSSMQIILDSANLPIANMKLKFIKLVIFSRLSFMIMHKLIIE